MLTGKRETHKNSDLYGTLSEDEKSGLYLYISKDLPKKDVSEMTREEMIKELTQDNDIGHA